MLAASLERRLPGYEAQLAPGAQAAGSPRERILHVFDRLEKASAEPAYRGCPYLAALVGLKDPEHPASVVARGAKEWMRDFFRARAEAGRGIRSCSPVS